MMILSVVRRSALVSLVAAIGLHAPVQAEESVSAQVRSACTSEARRLCPQHKLGSSEMRYCMEARFSSINRDCVRALEDDGLIPRSTQRQAQR